MAKRQESEIDLEVISPKDYTIRVKGLPKNVQPEQIFQKFGQLYNGGQAKITKLNLTYDIGRYVQLTQQKSTAELCLQKQTAKR